jgi:hypothetical protein
MLVADVTNVCWKEVHVRMMDVYFKRILYPITLKASSISSTNCPWSGVLCDCRENCQ